MIAGSGARSGPVLKPNMGQTAVSAVSQTASGECVCTCGVCVYTCSVQSPFLLSLSHTIRYLYSGSLLVFCFRSFTFLSHNFDTVQTKRSAKYR